MEYNGAAVLPASDVFPPHSHEQLLSVGPPGIFRVGSDVNSNSSTADRIYCFHFETAGAAMRNLEETEELLNATESGSK